MVVQVSTVPARSSPRHHHRGSRSCNAPFVNACVHGQQQIQCTKDCGSAALMKSEAGSVAGRGAAPLLAELSLKAAFSDVAHRRAHWRNPSAPVPFMGHVSRYTVLRSATLKVSGVLACGDERISVRYVNRLKRSCERGMDCGNFNFFEWFKVGRIGGGVRECDAKESNSHTFMTPKINVARHTTKRNTVPRHQAGVQRIRSARESATGWGEVRRGAGGSGGARCETLNAPHRVVG